MTINLRRWTRTPIAVALRILMAFGAFHAVAMRFSDEEVACRAGLRRRKKMLPRIRRGSNEVFNGTTHRCLECRGAADPKAQ
jgi:hypothetical protein